jgi:Kdo2-lipid IVA lauroyltransferase/acyltransferase
MNAVTTNVQPRECGHCERKPRVLSRIGHYLGYVLFRALLCVAGALSPESCDRIAGGLAGLMFDVIRFRRRVVLENLRHAYPELTEGERVAMARRMWRHLLLFAAETVHLPRKIHLATWRRYLRLDKADEFTRIMLGERPLVMATGHYGNFELAGLILGMFGYTTHAIARPMDNPYLDAYMTRSRARNGIRILSKSGDHERISQILASGGIVSFLADQYAGSKGCWVDFFGRPASAHKAVALFALEADALLLVGHCRRIGPPLHYEMTMDGLADPRTAAHHVGGIRELTQWFTSRIESGIRLAPDQYWWVHRRWKDNRPARRRARQAA